VFEKGVFAGAKWAGSSKDWGGEEAETQLKEARILVFFAFADDDKLLSPIEARAVGYDFALGELDEMGVKRALGFYLVREIRGGPAGPSHLPFWNERDLGGSFLNTDWARADKKWEGDEKNPHKSN